MSLETPELVAERVYARFLTPLEIRQKRAERAKEAAVAAFVRALREQNAKKFDSLPVDFWVMLNIGHDVATVSGGVVVQ